LDPFLKGILSALAVQIIGFVFLYFWKKRQEAPETIKAALEILIGKLDTDFKSAIGQLEQRIEKRLDHTEDETKDREEGMWDVLDALRKENVNNRGDIIRLQTETNGVNWKQQP